MPDRPDHHVDLHVPKLETFDVPASANVDPKGFVREVDSFTVHPHGLYMRRGADHPAFGYLESWLLPALGLRVNVFHFRPGATPHSHRYIDVVEVGGDRRGDGARDVGKRGGTPEGMGGGAPTAATRTAPMTEPGDLPVDVWRTRDLYLDILELDGRVRVEDADELTAALAAGMVSAEQAAWAIDRALDAVAGIAAHGGDVDAWLAAAGHPVTWAPDVTMCEPNLPAPKRVAIGAGPDSPAVAAKTYLPDATLDRFPEVAK